MGKRGYSVQTTEQKHNNVNRRNHTLGMPGSGLLGTEAGEPSRSHDVRVLEAMSVYRF